MKYKTVTLIEENIESVHCSMPAVQLVDPTQKHNSWISKMVSWTALKSKHYLSVKDNNKKK